MEDLTEINSIAFQMIAAAGAARSAFITATHKAQKGDFNEAARYIAQGNEYFSEGHSAHSKLIKNEAAGSPTHMNLMLSHAEDQMMGAELFSITAAELIDSYREIEQLKQEVRAALPIDEHTFAERNN